MGNGAFVAILPSFQTIRLRNAWEVVFRVSPGGSVQQCVAGEQIQAVRVSDNSALQGAIATNEQLSKGDLSGTSLLPNGLIEYWAC